VTPHLKGVCRILMRAFTDLVLVSEDSGLSMEGSADSGPLPIVRSRSLEEAQADKRVRFQQRALSLPGIATSVSVTSSTESADCVSTPQVAMEGAVRDGRGVDGVRPDDSGQSDATVRVRGASGGALDSRGGAWDGSAASTVLPWSSAVVEPDPQLVRFLSEAGCTPDDIQCFVVCHAGASALCPMPRAVTGSAHSCVQADD